MNQVLQHLEQLARLTRGRDRDSVDGTLVEVLQPLLEAQSVTLWEALPDPDGDRLLLRARAEHGRPASESIVELARGEVFQRVRDDAQRASAWETRKTRLVTCGGGARLLVPIFTESDRRLLIEAAFKFAPDNHRVQVAEGMARIFENFIDLLDSSEHDPLTGLLNRKSFDDAFYKATRVDLQALDGVGRRQLDGGVGAYWLAVVDVDHFKTVNDRYGHLIGDEVLLLIARILRNTFRHDDRLYRFGGEEFVVLARAVDAAAAGSAFERLRCNVEGFPFPQVGRITVSVGYTSVREHDTPSDAFERADRAVYLAKAQGRNQVRGYETDVQAGQPEAHRGQGGDVELF
jgi:diguanylate cyclase (GGDEF)-like protein